MNNIREYLFQVRVFDSGGDIEAVYDDLLQLTIRRYINRPGMAVILVPDGHDILNYAVLDQHFIFHLIQPIVDPDDDDWGVGVSLVFQGFFRDAQTTIDDYGNIYHLLYVTHVTEVLDRYVIAYPSGTNNKTSWTGQNIAVIANDLVIYNATADATTANDRIRDAQVVRSLEDTGAVAGTAVIDFTIAPGRNLLDMIRELARLGEFDFTVATSDMFTPGGLVVIQYDFLGTDRSTTIHFDVNLDNAARANLSGDALREKTVAIVGGPGDGSARTFEVRTGANHAADNDKEMFVDASGNLIADLPAIGDKAMIEMQARIQLQTNVVSSLGFMFMRDYTVGDLVSVYIGNVIAVKRIDMAEITFGQDPPARITIELVEPDTAS